VSVSSRTLTSHQRQTSSHKVIVDTNTTPADRIIQLRLTVKVPYVDAIWKIQNLVLGELAIFFAATNLFRIFGSKTIKVIIRFFSVTSVLF
jgi:hypothetical protein